jgi:flagellar hook-length control protein FliK
MKIVGSEAPIDDPNANSEDAAAVDQTDDESSTFAQLLAKKRSAAGEDHGTKPKSTQQQADGIDTAERGVARQKEGTATQTAAVKGAEGSRIVELPRELQALVHEISVSLNGAKHKQVNIELNSNVLKGLHIQIEQQGTGVSIQFVSASDSVGAMLTRNMSALSEALANRGVDVNRLQVTTSAGTTRAGAFAKGGSAGSSEGKGGRR